MKQMLVLLMLFCSIGAYAQDVIVKKNGSTIVCRIVEINSSEVVYKKWTDLKGSNYVMDRADVTAVNYENGRRVLISELSENQFAPGLQNTGVQQLSDNALLNMDIQTHRYGSKAKRLRAIGWVGGSLLAGAGLAIYLGGDDQIQLSGLLTIGAGCVWTGGFLLAASHYQKKANSIVQSTPIWQNEFKLKDGKALVAGVNVLKEQIHQSRTIGLSLRCNF